MSSTIKTILKTANTANSLKLFQETQLGALRLKNKFVVAPMTRMRADPVTGIPNDLMIEYYSQRSQFGLILTECSQISSISNAHPGAGGIFTSEQVAGWKKVVDAVHKQQGLIMLQMYHCGRSVSSSLIGGAIPFAPSPIAINGKNFLTKNEPFPIPHEMSKNDILQVIKQFKQAAKNAKEAGFDGVELHGGNGYLVDQFLRDSTNKRKDNYGGSIENRCRFCLEVIDNLCEVYGSDRVSVRFSPTGRYNDIFDSNPLELMRYLLGKLNEKNLSFVELKRHGANDKHQTNPDKPDSYTQIPDFFNQMRLFYKGNLVANDSISIDEAINLTNNEVAQAISFGQLSISNPDLPLRIQNVWEINQTKDKSTWFFGGPKGYIDFPAFQ